MTQLNAQDLNTQNLKAQNLFGARDVLTTQSGQNVYYSA